MAGTPISLSDFFDPLGPGAQEVKDFTTAIQGLGRNYRAFAKNLEGDAQRVNAGLATLKDLAGPLRQQVAGLAMATDQERTSFAALSAEISRLAIEQKRLQDVQASQARGQAAVKDATQQAAATLRAMRNELREAYAAQDTARIEKAAGAILQYKNETQALSLAVRGANSELTAARGSYDALDAKNKQLIVSLRALGNGIEGGGEQAAQLRKQIADNTQTLKSFDESILIFGRNVGNYKDGFAPLVQELAKIRAQQSGLAQDSQLYQNLEQKRIGFLTAAQKAAAQAGLSYEQAGIKIEQYTAAIQPTVNNLVRLEKAQQDVAKSAGADSEEYRKLGFQIQSTKRELESIPAATEKAGSGFKAVGEQLGFTRDGLVGQLTQLGVGLIGVQAIFSGVGAAFATDKAFESALSSVSALTGATGEDLQFMADKAKELGPAVGKSADEVLKAFELVGSAQPALLDSKENLAGVTEQALLLAAAAKEELPAAAEALTGVMNQFSASAGEAGRYVNALAAGAKEGAATIPQTAESLKYFGVNAATANISVEKSVALIQLLAERSIKGEQAGTQLRAVLAKLASGARETNPEVVGLSTALDNLGKKNLSTAQYTKLFGLENANTARVLTEGREKVEALTLAVTGTGAANEQAAKQLDNIATAGGRFTSVLKNLVVGALDPFTRGATRFLNEISGIGQKLLGLTKSNQENTAATLAGAQANEATAASAQKLLGRYQDLTARGLKPTKDGKGELNAITLQLRDSLGESVASLDKETGALVLNEEATKKLIKQKLLLSNQAVSTLILEADALKDRQKQEQLDIKSGELQITTRERLLGLTRAQAQAQVDDFVNNQGYGELNKDVERLSVATYNLSGARQKLAQTTADYNAKLAALDKLGAKQDYLDGVFGGATKAADALDKVPAALGAVDVILDRNAKAEAERRRAALQGQLADTQKRIDDLKKLQAEQGKLFDDKQLSPEVFKASVATTQDQITALERTASATRIAVLRAERDEKLITINDEAIKAKKAKGVSAAELTDIEQAAATKRLAVVQQFGRDVAKEATALGEKLEVKPIEFKVAILSDITLAPVEKALNDQLRVNKKTYEETVELARNSETAKDNVLLGALARREITQGQYEAQARKNRRTANEEILAADKAFHKANLDDQQKANRDILDDVQATVAKRVALIEKVGGYVQEAEGAYSQIRGNLIDGQIQRENDAYAQQIKVAGDNAELKTKIEEDHQKRLAKLNYDKAKAERDAAVISIAINTAVAVAKAFAEYVFPFALIPAGIALAEGALLEAAVLSRPLPSYFVGREDGPAEYAHLAERGPELVGQPGSFRVVAKQAVGYLEAGDRVFTAPETRQILQQNEVVEGRIVQRQQGQDQERQTQQLRTGAQARQAAERAAAQQSNQEVVKELRAVRRAIHEQEYQRLNEQDDLVRRRHREQGWQDMVNRRYKGGKS
ncbi:phage tail tape measure protein [Hymenobacter nivis]|uniref:Phage tail tape measure protein n=1 Tax=Hymenobacter nivis TaxID=1850093 RepID=A0A502GUZ5_9BACT|nr:phage tail tape measure protein [Hymenobacter nivis]TPG66049.1 phage tail tape measure protein [Hymenobacter nivis]